jgi:fanconi-associated nuclease 1
MGTLFALLFWDILFIAVPGAFETAYQTAPLDLWEDSFYISRREAIELRLKEIACGEAWNIVRIADERERPKQTWCIGLKWELFTSDDLMHITQVRQYLYARVRRPQLTFVYVVY